MSKSQNIKEQSLNCLFDFWPLSYVDHNRLSWKKYSSFRKKELWIYFVFLDCEHSSTYLSLDFYMENFHLFIPPLLPEKGTFLTLKRHMLEEVSFTHMRTLQNWENIASA